MHDRLLCNRGRRWRGDLGHGGGSGGGWTAPAFSSAGLVPEAARHKFENHVCQYQRQLRPISYDEFVALCSRAPRSAPGPDRISGREALVRDLSLNTGDAALALQARHGEGTGA